MGRLTWTVEDVLDATRGERILEIRNSKFEIRNPSFSGVSIDSRNVGPGELFVAIRGEAYDGHDFVRDAVGKGARGILVNRKSADRVLGEEWDKENIVCVVADDTIRALGDLAAFRRRRSGIPLIAITGSNGKTTTRAMTAGVMGRRFRTLCTRGNFNNEIGLPLTLLELDESHEKAVVELGMNHFGEIRRLSEICSPDVGMITNIGPAHLEGVGSLEGVMRAKGELLENIRPGGTIILNADDPMTPGLRALGQESLRVLLFGLSQDADVSGRILEETATGTDFLLCLPDGEIRVRLPVPGRFMVSDALAAASAGYVLGLSPEEIRAGLEDFSPVGGRLNIFETDAGIHIVDDTYNANPGSMIAALSTLASLRGKARGVFVAGDMFELGEQAAPLHKKVGMAAARAGIARLYAAGAFARDMAAGAREQGMNPQNIFAGEKKEIMENLRDFLMPGDWVLVKGSRAMGMEDIVKGLRVGDQG